jgi:prepilin-type N-terminal cleavage/methylation domain-containing protein
MSRDVKAPLGTRTRPRLGTTGFTFVELLLAMIVSGIVAGTLYGLMTVQNRGYLQVRESADVHGTLRSTATLLAWDLKYASPGGGDLYTIGPNSVELRSIQGTAVVCSKEGGGHFGLFHGDGDLSATADSALVYSAAGLGPADDHWKVLDLQDLPAGGANCDWPGTPGAQRRLHVNVASPSDTSGIKVGAPARTFRRVEYGTFQWRGHWWAGRRVVAGAWEPLAGPLADSAGLGFAYFDGAGAATTNPAQVRAVELLLRAESAGRTGPGRARKVDSLRVKVNLRD